MIDNGDRGKVFETAIVLAAGVLFIVLVWRHWTPVAGPPYFHWPWYDRSDTSRVVWRLLLAAIPLLVAPVVARRSHGEAVALVIIAPALIQWTAASLAPGHLRGIDRAEAIIVDANQTSYFTAATTLEPGWLSTYENVLTSAQMHARTKPPGPVAFYYALIRTVGVREAPGVAALLILLFSSAAVAATYLAVKIIAGSDTALEAAILLASVPSMVALYPTLDWLYPVFSVGLLATLHVTVERLSARLVLALGVIAFVLSWWNYALLVLGTPIVLLAGIRSVRGEGRRMMILLSGIPAVVAMLYGALFVTTRFNPISAFLVAYREQHAIIELMNTFWIHTGQVRAYPHTIFGDLQEFAFGLGWLTAAAAITWCIVGFRHTEYRVRATALVALSTPIIVALTGLLRAETARVWIFLMPFVALPAALFLVRRTLAERMIAHLVAVLGAIAVFRNALFVY
jgi:hypothetical protein